MSSPTAQDHLAEPALHRWLRHFALAAGSRRLGGTLMGLWFAYLLLAPTVGFGWIESWHNEQRVIEVILLVLTMLWFGVAAPDADFRRRLPRLHWSGYTVFTLGAISAWRGQYREAALTELALLLLLLVLVLTAAAVVATDPARAKRFIRWGAVLLLATYVAGVACQYAAAFSIQQPLSPDVLLLGYANPRFPSALHALLIPFAVSLALDPSEHRAWRVASWVVLCLTWAINLALGTRAIWFAYAVTYAMLFAMVGRQRIWPSARATLCTALAGVALYLLLFRFLPLWTGIGENFSQRSLDKLIWGSNRELLIRSSLEAVRSAPWLGLGPMQFAAIPHVWAAHPHNWILQLASEWGLPATVLALWGIFGLLRRALASARSSAPADKNGVLAATTASLVALAYGLVDGNLVMPISQVAAAICFGALLGAAPARPVGFTRPPGPMSVRLLRLLPTPLLSAVLIGAAVQLSWFTAKTVTQATAQEATERIFPTHALWPRFWSDGFLPVHP